MKCSALFFGFKVCCASAKRMTKILNITFVRSLFAQVFTATVVQIDFVKVTMLAEEGVKNFSGQTAVKHD